MSTPETAWAEAMTFDNRADPYPFFDALRNTPVAKVADDTYVVAGYRELLALAHDPQISSNARRSRVLARLAGQAEPVAWPEYLNGEAEQLKAYVHDQSIIVSDPPEHDRARRLLMSTPTRCRCGRSARSSEFPSRTNPGFTPGFLKHSSAST